jgi:hypothetical protein
MEKGRAMYRVVVRKTKGKRAMGKPRRRCEDNIKMDLQGVGVGGMDWTRLAQDRKTRRALVEVVMKLRVHKKCGEFLD